ITNAGDVVFDEVTFDATLAAVDQTTDATTFSLPNYAGAAATLATTDDISAVQADVNDLVTLSGVAVNSTNLGVFTGSTITDNTATVKSALQQLETAVEAATPSSLQAAYDVGNTITTSGGNALTISGTEQVSLTSSQASPTAIVLDANNTGGGIDINAGTGTGTITMDAGGAVSIQGGAASTINTTSANLTLSTTTSGTLAANSVGILDLDGNTGVTIDANTSGDVTVNSTAGSVTLSGAEAVADAIDINATNAGGGIDIDAGATSGTVTIDAGGAVSVQGGAASDVTTTAGLLSLTGDDGVAITSSTTIGVTIDAATAGTVDINAAAGAINIGNDAVNQTINIGTGGSRDINIGNSSIKAYSDGKVSIGYSAFPTSYTDDNVANDDAGVTFEGSNANNINTNDATPLTTYSFSTANTQFAVSGDVMVDGQIASTGAMIAGGFTATSDKRLKTNIKDLDNVLSKIPLMRGVSYDWKKESAQYQSDSSAQIGVIAQEIEEIYPQLVTTHSNGIKTVNYQGLVPVLIEAIKEQQKLIDRLIADLTEEKASATDLKSALEEQRKLSAMQVEIMSKLQSENSEIKSDVEMLKDIVLGSQNVKKD
ncbi:tail fiber domain-containing protein, partial [Ekhidna sp.]|uniref:tail fiber domain-containing protein n=2 Tax=Ekhidna sp. TaxID=2608089 RepID=UPI003296CBE5